MRVPAVLRRPSPPERERSALSIDEYVAMLSSFEFNGLRYTLPGAQQEEIGLDFLSQARRAYKRDAVVFACMLVRMLLFSEARFQFRERSSGRPGNLFGTADLALLEQPWPGGTTGDLLTRMLCFADLGGNAYVTRRRSPGGDSRLQLLRPDWTTIVIGVPGDPQGGAWDLDSEVLGYLYQPGGPGGGRDPVALLREEVAHFAPIPDPEAQFRGMSWLTPLIREVMADKAATDHKLEFFEHAATPQMVVSINVDNLEKFEAWVELFREKYEGRGNAYKTMFLGAGHDATVVGKDFQQLEFKATQGAGETRIAAAAGVPPVIVGLSEGLAAATYSNYGQARRRFADGTMRPLWRNVAASLQTLVPAPGSAELWYDDRDIPFLAEDVKDQAEVMNMQATAIKTFVDAGYDADTAVEAVRSGDLSRLKHSGMLSVQLRPSGQNGTAGPAGSSSNGAAREPVPAGGE